MRNTLLIELLTEELPPKLLERIGAAFRSGISDALVAQDFAPADTLVEGYASPRRLALTVADVAVRQPDRTVTRKGPAHAAGLTAEGMPTPALAGFARSCGVAVEQLQTARDPKGQDIFVFHSTQPGKTLTEALPEILNEVLQRLPVAKVMRWGAGDAQFVRPVHGLVVLHGSDVLPVEAMGLSAGNSTRGHRFLSSGTVVIPHADQYAATLEREGRVLASFAVRRSRIEAALRATAGEARVLAGPALLDEVTALVEWPAIYAGTFNPEFLAVPQECLILSMQQHQKYFPLGDRDGKLLPRFLVVSNLETATPQSIIHGNERVLRARLSDARFFFEQDRKTPLSDRIPRLEDVVYHNKLGSMLARVHRLVALAGTIASLLDVDVIAAKRAATLMKADLLTDMVGEFPELQGLMGHYYALHDGESAEVAEAIEAHYHPRFAQDSLPKTLLGACVALADKLDTLAGIYGIGLIPTGDRDPFALRRAALGVIRILVESGLPLELPQLLQHAVDGFAANTLAATTVADLNGFILERLRGVLRDREYSAEEVESVVSQSPARLDRVLMRLNAVRAFRALPEAESLAAADKRVRNILKKSAPAEGAGLPVLQSEFLMDPAEKALHAALLSCEPVVDDHLVHLDYTAALRHLAQLRTPVDTFFNEVMVNAEDARLRANRLALLMRLGALMNQVADLSRLGG
jgi:glycyl-tRNA synthetase beta chain